MNEIKEQQKKLNIEKANKKRIINRKIHKFNNFNNEDNKRNKAERNLYSILNEEQKKEFKIRVELLGLNMDFFKEIYLLGFGVSLFGVATDWKISINPINKIKLEEVAKLFDPSKEIIKLQTEDGHTAIYQETEQKAIPINGQYNFIVSTVEEMKRLKKEMSGKNGDWTASPNFTDGKFIFTFTEKTASPQNLINPINESFNEKTNEEKINIVMDLVAQGAEIENNILIPPPPLSLKKPSNKKIITKK